MLDCTKYSAYCKCLQYQSVWIVYWDFHSVACSYRRYPQGEQVDCRGSRGMSSKPPAQEQIKSKMEFLICLLCLFFLFRKCKSPYCCSSPQHRSRPFNAAKCISELFLFIGHHFHLCFIFSSERACWQVLQINVEASALLIHNWKFIHRWAERFFHRLKTWEAIYI